jgi:uncharacterized protein (DUF362 family)/ferredoxin
VDRVASYEYALVKDTVSEILDTSGLSWRGKKVLVKPNMLAPFTPEKAVTTHPVLVRAVRDALRERGSEVVVGDNPGLAGYGSMVKVSSVTGLGEAGGDDFLNLAKRPKKVPMKSRFTEQLSVCSEVFEVDYYVSLPKFKTHMLTILTGGIKNSFGLVVGGQKARMHARANTPAEFAELLVDIYSIRPPDLVIMDAITGMEGFGPSAGSPRDIGCILSSTDGAALDLAMCMMTGLKPSRYPTVKVATHRGLVPSSIDEIEIAGELPRLQGFKLPPTLFRVLVPWRGARLVLGFISKPRFRVKKDLCDACATCAKGCPAGVITVDRFPVFDRRKCIGCYCCYELCPQNALEVAGFIRFFKWLESSKKAV